MNWNNADAKVLLDHTADCVGNILVAANQYSFGNAAYVQYTENNRRGREWLRDKIKDIGAWGEIIIEYHRIAGAHLHQVPFHHRASVEMPRIKAAHDAECMLASVW